MMSDSMVMVWGVFNMGVMFFSAFDAMQMCVILSIGSTCLMSLATIDTSTTWMEWIFFMLLTGAILIMFMILSALMPNQEMGNKLSTGFWVVPMTAFPMCASSSGVGMKTMISTALESSGVLTGVLALMICYFSFFVKMMGAGHLAMRTMEKCFEKSFL